MSAQVWGAGPIAWSGSRNAEGHRTYKVTNLVKTTSTADGPERVFNAAGLPLIGSIYLIGNDFDVWAFCRPDRTIRPWKQKGSDPTIFWAVESTFSTLQSTRCQDETIEDPLNEPMGISGTFVRHTKEATQDKDGNAIVTSAFEKITGPQVEIDDHRPTVNISQNVLNLGLEIFTPLKDTVNTAPLWGLPARTIKLSGITFERKVFGLCNFYYTRNFEFQINFNTFDRDDIIDEGIMAFGGYNNADPPVWVVPGTISKTNPQHATRYKDANGENARTLLDGSGEPLGEGGTAVPIPLITDEGAVKFYSESNFLVLGIPTTL